jgi:Zn-dependent peptidase ImmA (M78 family)
MEEISHHLLRHKPTGFYQDPATGLQRRQYNPAQEREAYDFGSMMMLPKELIQRHVKNVRGTAEELAARAGCSVELVHFRIKRCRLWERYLALGGS